MITVVRGRPGYSDITMRLTVGENLEDGIRKIGDVCCHHNAEQHAYYQGVTLEYAPDKDSDILLLNSKAS